MLNRCDTVSIREYKYIMFALCVILGSVVPGAGAFEIAAHSTLVKYKEEVKGRSRLGK